MSSEGQYLLKIHDVVKTNGLEVVVVNEALTYLGKGWVPLKDTVYNAVKSKPLLSSHLRITNQDVVNTPSEKLFTIGLPRKAAVYDPANQAVLGPRKV